MPIESRAVCAKSLTPQKSGHQRKTGHSLVQNGPRMMERGQYPPLELVRTPLVATSAGGQQRVETPGAHISAQIARWLPRFRLCWPWQGTCSPLLRLFRQAPRRSRDTLTGFHYEQARTAHAQRCTPAPARGGLRLLHAPTAHPVPPRRRPRTGPAKERVFRRGVAGGVQTLKNIVARRTATAARRPEPPIVRVVTQTIVAAANDIALCANS
jgi:hypothetical protein